MLYTGEVKWSFVYIDKCNLTIIIIIRRKKISAKHPNRHCLLEFFDIDRNIPIEDLVSDQEIINLVLQGDDELSDSANDEEELSKSISYREAHSARWCF